MTHVKSELEVNGSFIKRQEVDISSFAPPGFNNWPRYQELNASNTHQREASRVDETPLPAKDDSFSSSPLCPAPLCRQFWKAGNYDDVLASRSGVQTSKNILRVHPKFLHSNATSHKWAFGAIAELLDNAIDEIQNGASFVIVDKITDRRDGSPSLLIQDDGGGMDPEVIRRCMSFGFSDKESKSAIGKYGNGFKTGTMRLGADVIVFSQHVGKRTKTQSIGLLSYTYLSRAGLNRIVVPTVDYEYNISSGTFEPVHRSGREHFQSNLSVILHFSPYTTEVELMKQFDDIGAHGTKVLVFNLWLTDDGSLEFDFESDPEDICLPFPDNVMKTDPKMAISENHLGNQYRYSLRVYMSILYLRIPQNFSILLRGKVVEHHNIAHDLKYPEVILYRPHTGGTKEAEVLTTIGFLKEAPHVNIHGFNIYHKNRLILPFWQVVSYDRSRGRGVVGLLEANFIEPTHNKQDFEKTSLFQKLEARLKDMTWEYWDFHCGLIGYQVKKSCKAAASSLGSSYVSEDKTKNETVVRNKTSNLSLAPNRQADPVVNLPVSAVQKAQRNVKVQQHGIRTQDDLLSALSRDLRKYDVGPNATNAGHCREVQPAVRNVNLLNRQEAAELMQENKNLLAKCLEHEKAEEELKYRVLRLKKELEEAQLEYLRMFDELQSIEFVEA